MVRIKFWRNLLEKNMDTGNYQKVEELMKIFSSVRLNQPGSFASTEVKNLATLTEYKSSCRGDCKFGLGNTVLPSEPKGIRSQITHSKRVSLKNSLGHLITETTSGCRSVANTIVWYRKRIAPNIAQVAKNIFPTAKK